MNGVEAMPSLLQVLLREVRDAALAACSAQSEAEPGAVVDDGPGDDPWGQALEFPLDVDSDVPWIGCANAQIRARVEPALARRGLVLRDGAPSAIET